MISGTLYPPTCAELVHIPKLSPTSWEHSKVHLAMDVYDRTDLQDISQALNFVNLDVAKVLPTGSVSP